MRQTGRTPVACNFYCSRKQEERRAKEERAQERQKVKQASFTRRVKNSFRRNKKPTVEEKRPGPGRETGETQSAGQGKGPVPSLTVQSSSEEETPPTLPSKPTQFEAKQLERLLSGELNPPRPLDRPAVLARLVQLKVQLGKEVGENPAPRLAPGYYATPSNRPFIAIAQ